VFAHRLHGGVHRRARREAVVDEDDDFVFDVERTAISTVQTFAPFELFSLLSDNRVKVVLAHSRKANGLPIEHHEAGRDCTHRKFAVLGNAEFADDEDVERRLERPRYLIPDGNSAARQPQHDDILPPGVAGKLAGQHAAGVGTICEAVCSQHGVSGVSKLSVPVSATISRVLLPEGKTGHSGQVTKTRGKDTGR
jgi:hypothetical protein